MFSCCAVPQLLVSPQTGSSAGWLVVAGEGLVVVTGSGPMVVVPSPVLGVSDSVVPFVRPTVASSPQPVAKSATTARVTRVDVSLLFSNIRFSLVCFVARTDLRQDSTSLLLLRARAARWLSALPVHLTSDALRRSPAASPCRVRRG